MAKTQTVAKTAVDPSARPQETSFRTLALGFTASALLLAMAFVPYFAGVTVWFALVPALVVSHGVPLKRLFWVSWLAGYVNCVIIYYWLMIVTVPGGLLLPIYLAVYWPVFFVAVEALKRYAGTPRILSAIVLWPLLEFTRGTLMTGLPWYYLAHALYQWPRLIQAADLGGVLFVSTIVIAVNALLAEAVVPHGGHRRRLVAVVVVVAVSSVNLCYGAWRFATVTERRGPVVAMVQPNVPQSLKITQSERDSANIFFDLRRLTLDEKTRGADVVFWPETIMPGLADTDDLVVAAGMDSDALFDELAAQKVMSPAQRQAVLTLAASGVNLREAIIRTCGETALDGMYPSGLMSVTAKLSGKPLVAGCISAVLNGNNIVESYNRACYIDSTGKEVASYDKVHLVPFGEFIPFRKSFPPASRAIAAIMPIEPLTFVGLGFKVFDIGGYRYGPAICFEDTFSYIGREYRLRGADVLLNLTNDGWFGESFELESHLANALFRAVETRMAVVRSANTGISAVVSPRGVITARLVDSRGHDRGIKGVLTAEVPISPERPIYLAVGDWWLLFAAAALVFSVPVTVLKGRSKKGLKAF